MENSMEHHYAQALWEMVQEGLPAGRQGMKPKEAVESLRKVLIARGRQSLLPKIARAFARLAAREEARSRIILSVARQKDTRAAIKEVEKFLAEQKISDVDVCEEMDETLVGGWRLEGRGVLVDASWKKSLLSIYNQATQ